MRFFVTSLRAMGMALLCVLPLSVSATDSAKPGVAVTALGHGPDWQLDIMERDNRINFTLDGQAGSYRVASLGPTLKRDRKTTVYRVVSDTHSMSVFVKGIACQDSLTGKAHEVTVIIAYDGKGYGGCGDVLNR